MKERVKEAIDNLYGIQEIFADTKAVREVQEINHVIFLIQELVETALKAQEGK